MFEKHRNLRRLQQENTAAQLSILAKESRPVVSLGDQSVVMSDYFGQNSSRNIWRFHIQNVQLGTV